MEGWSGGRGSSWSYGQEVVGFNVSSPSGTIASGLSTAYASSRSHPSTTSMEAAAMHFLSLGIHGDVNGNNMDGCEEAEEAETGEDRIRSLVQEFFSARPLTYCRWSIRRVDRQMSVVERWVTELGVGWVLSLDDGASVREELDPDDAQCWIWALDKIAQTICFKRLFPDRGSMGLPSASICDEEGEHVGEGERCIPDQYHLVLFIQKTMLKVLTFVDVVVAWDPNMGEELISMDGVMPPPYNKIITLLGVHDALSEVSYKIAAQFYSASSVAVKRIENEMAILLSAYKSKVGEATMSTMEEIRTRLLEDGNDSSSSLNPQESSDIHKVTRSVMTYIRFLWANYSSVDAAIRGKYVPHIENVQHLDSMIIEMVSCLQEKLAKISESFPNQGLKFLFLLNNSYYIQEIHSLSLYSLQRRSEIVVNLTHKIEGYMEKYLQVSWALLLSCLINPTSICLGKNYSPLSKFESEFQKIYTTQKQWKVPDPRLRRRLRKVITNKIIPGYTEYIEDEKVTSPKISPLEMEAMLQEIFEG